MSRFPWMAISRCKLTVVRHLKQVTGKSPLKNFKKFGEHSFFLMKDFERHTSSFEIIRPKEFSLSDQAFCLQPNLLPPFD